MDPISGDDGEGESSSASSSLYDSIDNDDNKNSLGCIKIKKNKNKRVSWDRIHTREYSLVVGDHPLCQDGLPVSLGWQYDDHSCSTKSMNTLTVDQSKEGMKSSLTDTKRQGKTQLSERRQSYVFPRRLSYEERRDQGAGLSSRLQVRGLGLGAGSSAA